MPVHKTQDDLAQGNVPAQPRMRVEKNVTPLTLSTSWQRVVFGDSNPLNTNTYMNESSGLKSVDWDPATSLFRFNAPEDRNYTYCSYLRFECTNVLGVLTTQPTRVQYRFIIPNGRGAGLPLTFPFPGSDGSNGYGTFEMANLTTETRISNTDTIYASQTMRTNGVGFELRLSSLPVLGNIRLMSATALIYARG